MKKPPVPDNEIRDAAEAVTEFLTEAFADEFLRWDKDVNLAMATMVWNVASARRRGEPAYHYVAPELSDLHRRLRKLRETRWPEATWMLEEVDSRVENLEIVFTFTMWWEEHEYAQPCEMTWVQTSASQARTN